MTGEGDDPGEVQAMAMMTLVENTGRIVEACAGYREKAKASGFTADTAEAMALSLHDVILSRMFAALPSAGGGNRAARRR